MKAALNVVWKQKKMEEEKWNAHTTLRERQYAKMSEAKKLCGRNNNNKKKHVKWWNFCASSHKIKGAHFRAGAQQNDCVYRRPYTTICRHIHAKKTHTHTTHLQFQNGAPPAKSLVFIVIIIVRVSYAIIITTMIFVRSASKRLGAIMISFPASFSTALFFHNSSLFSCYALAQVVNLILSPSKISLWMLVFSNTTIANGIDLDCGHTETCTLKKIPPIFRCISTNSKAYFIFFYSETGSNGYLLSFSRWNDTISHI